jgi:hypothetical protein
MTLLSRPTIWSRAKGSDTYGFSSLANPSLPSPRTIQSANAVNSQTVTDSREERQKHE